MKHEERIRKAFERNEKALTLRPAIGQGTAVTKVRIREGLTCEIEDGPWKFTADYSEKSGGDGLGPDPGVFGRTALGSCLAIGYALWAAKRGVPIDGISVEVQADYDARGHYGLDDVPRGYSEVRYCVTVETEASEEEIVRLLDEADRCSPYLEVFREPQNLKRQLRLVSKRG
jgi:uncharacterized OsmC-like protein